MNKKCQQHKKDGSSCNADVQSGKDVCVFHDPGKVEEREKARRAGGLTRSRRAVVLTESTPDAPLTRAEEVATLMADTINQVRRGQLDSKVASTVGYLSGTLLKALEQGALERKVAALESLFDYMFGEQRRMFESLSNKFQDGPQIP